MTASTSRANARRRTARTTALRAAWLHGVVACAALLPCTARAADAQASAASQQLFEEGRDLVNGGHAAEACPKFEESYRLDPRTGTKFNLADCYEKLGRIASAWTLFLEVAAESKAARRGDREQVARERAGAILARLPRLSVEVPDAHRVPGLAVERNGIPIGTAQWGSPVPVDPGDYTVRATAPGRTPWEASVRVEGEAAGSAVTVPLLAPVAGAEGGGDAEATEREPRPGGPSAQRLAAYGAGGVGVVALGIGTFFGIKALSKLNESESAGCSDNVCVTPAGREAYDDARSAGSASTVAFTVAGVALAGGLVLYLTEPGPAGGAPAESGRLSLGVGLGSIVAEAAW